MNSNHKQHISAFLSKSDLVIPVVVALVLVATRTHHYLLFHTLAELFAVIVAVTMFVVVWHTYPFTRNHFLTYLGTGYFWVACVDLIHAMTYKGMGTLGVDTANTTLEYWISARYFEALLLLSTPLFLRLELKRALAFTLFGLLFVLINLLVISGVLPEMIVEGKGLTSFKINSEYIIIGILITAGAVLYSKRRHLEKSVLYLLLISIGFTVLAEFSFTSYVSPYGDFNLLGHIFKFFSFWFIYLSVIRNTLSEPYRVMARGANTYQAIALPTLLVDHHGIIQQANQAALRATGTTEDELLYNHCHNLFHSRQLSQSECPVCDHIQRDKPLAGYELEISPAGKWKRISLSHIGPKGDLRGLVHVCEDITKRKQAEQTLHATKARFRTLVESTPDWIWEVDAQGIYTYASPQVQTILGYQPEELIGRTPFDFMPPEEMQRIEATFGAIMAERHPFNTLENVNLHKDGRLVVRRPRRP